MIFCVISSFKSEECVFLFVFLVGEICSHCGHPPIDPKMWQLAKHYHLEDSLLIFSIIRRPSQRHLSCCRHLIKAKLFHSQPYSQIRRVTLVTIVTLINCKFEPCLCFGMCLSFVYCHSYVRIYTLMC